jgi:DNA-binding transcriptional MerR regulator
MGMPLGYTIVPYLTIAACSSTRGCDIVDSDMSTYTISSLRKALGLSTSNQVRNRIEAIKDLLQDHLRRGPNNQILLSDAGVDLLRRLQELHDSGLTMTEASAILRSTSRSTPFSASFVSSGLSSNHAIPRELAPRIDLLQAQLDALRDRLAFLERCVLENSSAHSTPAWWEHLREDLDAA